MVAVIIKRQNTRSSDKFVLNRLSRLEEKVYHENYIPKMEEIPFVNDPEPYLSSNPVFYILSRVAGDIQKRAMATALAMPPLLRRQIDLHYRHLPNSVRDYNLAQLPWLMAERTVLAQKAEREIGSLTSDDKIKLVEGNNFRSPILFRVYWYLMNPDRIEIK